MLHLLAPLHALAAAATSRLRSRLGEDRGQSTAEYALVLLGAAAIALLVVAWATETDKVTDLFDSGAEPPLTRYDPPTRGPTRERHGPERGQATVELALLLPVVVVLLLAVLQLGIVARDVVLVTHASREAARAAAVDDAPGAALEAARASSGLDPDRLEVAVSGRNGPGSRVRVEVTYRIPTSVPIVGALIADPTVTSTATMRVEGEGRSIWGHSDEVGHWAS